MATRDNNWTARRILADLDAKVNRTVNADREFVNEFIRKVDDEYSRGENGIVVQFVHGGSVFEGLPVDESADCDITVLIGKPLEMPNFHVERDESKYFTLRWKSHVKQKIYSDINGNVKAGSIRSTMFDALICAIKSAAPSDAQVKIKRGLAAVIVEVERGWGRKLSFDFVPQLVFRSWDQCPDTLKLRDMPVALRKYIDTLNKNKSPVMCFPLAVRKKERYSNGEYLFDISFSMLEKEYFRKNTSVRDMVRLVKYVSDKRGWKADPFAFKPMYAKRVAIKNDVRLRNESLWEGYQTLLECLREELKENGTFDGHFVTDQVTYKKDRDIVIAFIQDINYVLELSPDEIKSLSPRRESATHSGYSAAAMESHPAYREYTAAAFPRRPAYREYAEESFPRRPRVEQVNNVPTDEESTFSTSTLLTLAAVGVGIGVAAALFRTRRE